MTDKDKRIAGERAAMANSNYSGLGHVAKELLPDSPNKGNIDKRIYEMCFNKPNATCVADVYVEHSVDDEFLGQVWRTIKLLQAQVVERDKRISAYKSLVASQEKITSWYRQQDYSHSEPRLKQLEESLESERAMNAKLTEELEATINKAGE